MKLLALLSTLLLAGCFFSPTAEKPLEFEGKIFGSYYKVKYLSGPTTPGPAALRAEVEALLKAYDEEFSLWKGDSMISRFNRQESLAPMPVSVWGVQIIEQAKVVHRESGGAFDPTVAPLVKLWGFGPKKEPRVPTQAELRTTLKSVGLDKLSVQDGKWVKAVPLLQVDLNSVAPGHAADLIGEVFLRRDIKHFLIDVGGELLARGEKAQGLGWRVGIERPALEQGSAGIVASVVLRNQAIATSGNYRNFLDTSKGRVSHTIDPRTGKNPQHHIVSATVVAPTALLADAWATAAMVQGLEALAHKNLPVYLLEGLPDGKLQEHMNDAMRELLASSQE